MADKLRNCRPEHGSGMTPGKEQRRRDNQGDKWGERARVLKRATNAGRLGLRNGMTTRCKQIRCKPR